MSSDPESWRYVVAALSDALSKEAVHLGPARHEVFLQTVAPLNEALQTQTDGAGALIQTGTLLNFVRQHNAAVQAVLDQSMETLRSISGQLLEFVTTSSVRAGELEESLADLQGAVASGESPEAIQAAQARLVQVLERVKARNATQKSSSEQLADRLQERLTILEQLRERAGVQPPEEGSQTRTDAATGLPLKPEAEAAIAMAFNTTRPMFLAIFYVERMLLTNGRFGRAIGDQVLMLCSQHIATRLIHPSDALFRWNGPGFVALLERADSTVSVTNEVQRFLGAPLSQYFEMAFRTLYLPIKMTGETLPLKGTTYAEVIQRVDAFMARASELSL